MNLRFHHILEFFLFAFSIPLNAQTCTAPPTALAAWWSGDGHYFDLVGSNHGTPGGGTSFAPGKVLQGFAFNGLNQSITIPYAPVLDVPPTGFTVTFWMKAGRDQTDVVSSIVDKDHSGGDGDYSGWEVSCWRDTGRLSFGIGDGKSFPLCTNTSDVLDNQFHHVAFAWDQKNWLIYVDGVLENSLSRPAVVNNTRPLRFGFHWGGASGTPMRFFKGVLDEVGLCPRALAPAEIAATYAAGGAGQCKPPFPAPAGLISWWPAEGSFLDCVGPNHGVPMGALGFAPGKVGQAFDFNGVDRYLVAPPVLTNAAAFTFEWWMKIRSFTHPYYTPAFCQPCESQAPACLPGEYYFYAGNETSYGSFRFTALARDSTACDLPSIIPFGAGAWEHVALTYDGNQAKIYWNGQLYALRSCAGKTFGNPTPLWLGKAFVPHTGGWHEISYLDGQMDELSIYSRALGSNEVAAIFAAGSAGKALPPALAVSLADGGVLLSWPASAAGFGLVARPALAAGGWEAVTNEPSLNGARKEVLLPIAAPAQRFFRLAP